MGRKNIGDLFGGEKDEGNKKKTKIDNSKYLPY